MTEPDRPSPEAFLAAARASEKSHAARLKVFLGMCPGVGKTFTMLESAHALRRKGIDVVVAVVETHGRRETEAMLQGLEVIPRAVHDYQGAKLEEMDVDAVLRRRPAVVLVDEFAHTNAPGSRHPKRYQDVQELLEAGLTVHTTLNVQHIESRVDVVRQITGVLVRETVPDSLIDRADEIELVDLSPDQLRQRLEEGKVYLGARATAAAENFFREENLIALREMALRYTAEKVDQELRQFLQTRRIRPTWRAHERLLVAVGPSPYAESLLRWTRRQAGMLDCPWTALYVDSGEAWSEETKDTISRYLGLARKLGAEVETVQGRDLEEAILRFAQDNGVTQIVLGKNDQPAWKRFFIPTFAERLIRRSGDIDILVVRPEKNAKAVPAVRLPVLSVAGRPDEWWLAAGIVGGVTALSWFLCPFTGYWSISMLYLLSVVLAAFRLSRWPLLVMAAFSALLWDFLFIPPQFTFVISETHDVLMFFMMFVVALVTGHLTSKLREREAMERAREQRTSTMLAFTQALSSTPDSAEALRKAIKMLSDLFGADLAILQRDNPEKLRPIAALGSTFQPDEKELGVAQWCYLNRQPAGKFTDTLSTSRALYLPLSTQILNVGVMAVVPAQGRVFDVGERTLLENFASQLAFALEKDHVLAAMQHAELSERSAHLQKTLLDSVSHELKTPLTALQAAADALASQTPASAQSLLKEQQMALVRLKRVINNLLDMSRLEAGVIQPKLEWCNVPEIIHAALDQAGEVLKLHPVQLEIPEELPFVKIDQALVEQCVCNLLLNAAAHTPAGTEVRVSVKLSFGRLEISVRDRGPGLPVLASSTLFDKFTRGPHAVTGGSGLGLSIVRGFVQALRGSVRAANHPEGGALFTLDFPVETLETLPEENA